MMIIFRGRDGGESGQVKGGGSGRKGGPFAAGPGGNCICPGCGHKIKHVRGKPCNQQKCPKCGELMTRE